MGAGDVMEAGLREAADQFGDTALEGKCAGETGRRGPEMAGAGRIYLREALVHGCLLLT